MADHKKLCAKILENKNYLRQVELSTVEALAKKDKVSDIVINELVDLDRRVSEHVFSPDAPIGEVQKAQKRIAAEKAKAQAPKPAPKQPAAEPAAKGKDGESQGGTDAPRA